MLMASQRSSLHRWVPKLLVGCPSPTVISTFFLCCTLSQLAEYEEIQPGMHCEVVILSRTRDFTELTGVTEAYLPALRLFVGQFPLMNKR